MGKSIAEITELMRKLNEERGFSQHHTPGKLITAIVAELGELAEHYQWKDNFDKWDEEKITEVGFEFVDVIWYLFTLADRSGIDIEEAFDKKLPKLNKKFPKKIGDNMKKLQNIRNEYKETGKNKIYD